MTGTSPLSWKQKIYIEGVLRSWWVILILLLCAVIYEPHFVHLQENEALLLKKLSELHIEKELALQTQAGLRLKIDSEQDHDWIEMTLMRKLGLVPEDQVKVIFTHKES